MRAIVDSPVNQEVISVWVRDPRIQKNDFWYAYIDYEICLHTNSLCFNKKISCVRRRYSEFVWLRQKLQANSLLITKLPELPPKNPFFSLNNARQITERMRGLQHFLEQIVQSTLLLSDSCLHLFLQSELSAAKMEACAGGRTSYSVRHAVQRCGFGLRRFVYDEDTDEDCNASYGSNSDSSLFPELEAGNGDPAPNGTETSAPLDVIRTNQEEPLCMSVST